MKPKPSVLWPKANFFLGVQIGKHKDVLDHRRRMRDKYGYPDRLVTTISEVRRLWKTSAPIAFLVILSLYGFRCTSTKDLRYHSLNISHCNFYHPYAPFGSPSILTAFEALARSLL